MPTIKATRSREKPEQIADELRALIVSGQLEEGESLGLEDPQRLAQRRARHAEALDQVGLTAERLALAELTADDGRPQLVGDLLGLLA